MMREIKEHLEEMVVTIAIKRVVPSLVVALAARLAMDSGQDKNALFSQKSVDAITALAVFATHYLLHIWFKLKEKDAAVKAANKEKGGN